MKTKTKKSKILQKDSPILREVALSVPLADIKTPKIKKIIDRMNSVLESQEDGVAIAAPQIGVSLRIFIVSGKVFSMKRGEDRKLHMDESAESVPNMVFINPVISKLSKKKYSVEEGCLSVRWLYGKVERSEKATVKAHDESGKLFTKGASGLLAQAFQHEIDHLDGILFIDKATEIEEIPPEKLQKNAA